MDKNIKSIKKSVSMVNDEEVTYYNIVLTKEVNGTSMMSIPAESEKEALEKLAEAIENAPEQPTTATTGLKIS